MKSAATGDKQRDDMLPQKEWFDSATFPTATLKGTGVDKNADGTFTLAAQLTIKNKTVPVHIPFTMVAEGTATRIKGMVIVKRGDFDIGSGAWANEAVVKHDVKINLDLLAH